MAAFKTSTTQDPCPTDEELAAFLDGTLPKAERERVTAHLADCESCYEIFAGAVHFQQGSASPDQEGTVVPFPSKKDREERPVRKRWWIPAAAAAVLALGIGLAGFRELSDPTALAKLVALHSKPVPAKDYYEPIRMRGGGDRRPSPYAVGPTFLTGVLLLDVALDREQGNVDPDRLSALGAKLEDAAGPQTSQVFATYAKKLRSSDPAARKEVAASLPGAVEKLDEDLSSLLPYSVGKWAEAGRLAALAQTPDFFSWANKLFLAKLLKEPLSQEEGVREHLEAIRAIWGRGIQAGDYDTLANHFTEIIRYYDRPSAE
jgi:Putative zinc-finger